MFTLRKMLHSHLPIQVRKDIVMKHFIHYRFGRLHQLTLYSVHL